MPGMSMQQYAEYEKLTAELNETLKAARQGDPAAIGARVYELHKNGYASFGAIGKEAHMGVSANVCRRPRFTNIR